MKRPGDQEGNLERIRRWRAACPDLTLRSTFIVGFPGETEDDFQQLLDFLRAARLDRVGCFTYSPVQGAEANALPGAVAEELKLERQARLMELQAEISAERLAEKIGRTLTVLVDEVDEDGAVARSSADAPEIDGLVFVEDATGLATGDFVEVVVEDADEHDLWAKRAA